MVIGVEKKKKNFKKVAEEYGIENESLRSEVGALKAALLEKEIENSVLELRIKALEVKLSEMSGLDTA